MTALSFSVTQPASPSARAVASSAPARQAANLEPGRSSDAQVSPASARNVTTGTIAAIQQLGTAGPAEIETAADKQRSRDAEPKSAQELQAEARRWERYYAHQPRRLADLLAVYYGGQHVGPDARGPAPIAPGSKAEAG